MSETILKTSELTKLYKQKPAVNKVSMNIHKGDIYGLIGKNGAGKTTLIRMITSLIICNHGTIEIFGETSETGLNNSRSRTGCVIETPVLYPNLSAVQNLEYYRLQRGIADKNIVQATLAVVGLTDTGKKKFKNFSLGMKQRLGIALSILNRPEFIILDEPVNGLDPIGIVEMREMLRKLNQEFGITILISSHILTELSMVATRYGIINDGVLIKELTSNELKVECGNSLALEVDDVNKAVDIIKTVLKTEKYQIISNTQIHLYDYLDNASEVSFQLNSNGVRVNSISQVGDSLEDYFTKLVGGAQ